MSKLSDDFLSGVIVALTEVDRAGDDVLYCEIVRLVGEEDLARVARKRREMRFSGLSKHLKEIRQHDEAVAAYLARVAALNA